MKNITKLSCWPELQSIGFKKCTFSFRGKVQAIGCYMNDITIEPKVQSFSDNKNYHLTGIIKTPFVQKLYRYEYGKKIEFFDRKTNMNDFISVSQILTEVKKML